MASYHRRIVVKLLPHAHLDPVIEVAIFTILHAQATQRALLIITHRLVQMASFETILVLDAGQIIERGIHTEMLAQDGLYRRLYARQNEVLAA